MAGAASGGGGLGPFANIAFVLITMNIAQKLNLMEEENVNLVRGMYLCGQLINFACTFIIRSKITSKNDQQSLTYTPAASGFGQPTPAPVTVTVKDYDLQQTQSFLKQNLINTAILLFLHFKFGYIQPLVLQTVLPLKSLYSLPLVQIHILGKSAEGKLKRPWVADNPLAAFSRSAETETTPESTSRPTPAVTGSEAKPKIVELTDSEDEAVEKPKEEKKTK